MASTKRKTKGAAYPQAWKLEWNGEFPTWSEEEEHQDLAEAVARHLQRVVQRSVFRLEELVWIQNNHETSELPVHKWTRQGSWKHFAELRASIKSREAEQPGKWAPWLPMPDWESTDDVEIFRVTMASDSDYDINLWNYLAAWRAAAEQSIVQFEQLLVDWAPENAVKPRWDVRRFIGPVKHWVNRELHWVERTEKIDSGELVTREIGQTRRRAERERTKKAGGKSLVDPTFPPVLMEFPTGDELTDMMLRGEIND